MRRVTTVLGPVDPADLGVTMMHEHVFVDATCHFVQPEDEAGRALLHAPMSAEILDAVRRQPLAVTLDNVVQKDEVLALEELHRYSVAGGRTIVDCTNFGIGRDPVALRRLSRVTGVQIVMGTGCYTERSHPAWVATATVDELADIFARDVVEGVDDTGIRAGIIGEIGTSGIAAGHTGKDKVGHLTAQEEKVLRAAGRASNRTGAAVSVHLDMRGQGALRTIDILADEGVPADRMVMGHLDQVQDLDYHRAVAARGVFLEYDALGRENHVEDLWFGSDEWRVASLATLVREGYADQIVLAQDMAFKTDFHRWGGPGLAHVLTSIVPTLREEGVPDAAIRAMLVDNPRRILSVESAP